MALQLSPLNQGYYGDGAPASFRLGQIDDKLILQIMQMRYGGPALAAPPIQRLELGDDASPAERSRRAAERFDALAWEDFERLGEEFKPARLLQEGPQFSGPTVRVIAEAGDVLVGRVTGRDMRTGQPLEITFKALIEPTEDAAR
jgi:hypothetical protein